MLQGRALNGLEVRRRRIRKHEHEQTTAEFLVDQREVALRSVGEKRYCDEPERHDKDPAS